MRKATRSKRMHVLVTPKVHKELRANNPQQSWGFEGEPPEAVIKDFGTRDGTS
jgi:hypothetical protein